MTHAWQTLPDGHVIVDGAVPLLEGGMYARLWQWFPSAKAHEQRTGVPAHWTLGVIHAESGGQPGARSSDGGLGLMQITHPSLKQGLSDAEVMVPENNLRLGTDFLRVLRGTGPASARDLPSVASRYNAGQRRDGSPYPSSGAWGMRATGDHIDRVVAAANTARAAELVTQPTGGGGDTLVPFPGLAALGEKVDALGRQLSELDERLTHLQALWTEGRAERLARLERMLRAALGALEE